MISFKTNTLLVFRRILFKSNLHKIILSLSPYQDCKLRSALCREKARKGAGPQGTDIVFLDQTNTYP